MRSIRRGAVGFGILMGLLILPHHSTGRADGFAPSIPYLEMEVPGGANLSVEADTIFLPPGASAHAPVRLPPGGAFTEFGGERASVRVQLPAAGNQQPSPKEVWADGNVTLTFSMGARVRLNHLISRARITFDRSDSEWRILVERLPAGSQMR